jgi:hypothetical protein
LLPATLMVPAACMAAVFGRVDPSGNITYSDPRAPNGAPVIDVIPVDAVSHGAHGATSRPNEIRAPSSRIRQIEILGVRGQRQFVEILTPAQPLADLACWPDVDDDCATYVRPYLVTELWPIHRYEKHRGARPSVHLVEYRGLAPSRPSRNLASGQRSVGRR